MFSHAIIPYRLRYYSTPTAALKLWVKHNGSPSTRVPVKGCINVDDFAKKVRQKLNTNAQVALYTSLEKNALRPGLKITELLKTDISKNSFIHKNHSCYSRLNSNKNYLHWRN
ncbi:hypothetical protein O5D80_002427 [Batrachochytrium dendrobatidis]|nr:hypothetical protein O5D80_002427 [Batrachochytrium dendrobatidis]